MKIKSILKYIGEVVVFALAYAVFICLAAALGLAATILLVLLGRWTGVDSDVFVYFSIFCISWKARDVVAWVVDKIADRIERKRGREYFND